MYENFSQIYNHLKSAPPVTIAVAAAQDEAIIIAIKEAYASGFAKAVLVGDADKIRKILEVHSFNAPIEIIDEKDEIKASHIAVSLVKSGDSDLLMKGLVNSSDFLRAVLNEKFGLRTSRLLSHLAAFEIPGIPKIAFYTDGGMNLFPDFESKKDITINGIDAMHSIGISNPFVAILTANEIINPKMPSTLDAAALVELNQTGKLPKCMIEGPIALDVALSPEAAAHKGIPSFISGRVDLFIVPNIEAGNMIGKSLIYYAGAKMAGVILGASCPIVMTSRAENAEGKLNSIALASLIHQK